MQWTDIAKDWKNVSLKFKAKWPKLTDADLKAIAGKREELLRRLGEHYPAEKAELTTKVDAFIKA